MRRFAVRAIIWLLGVFAVLGLRPLPAEATWHCPVEAGSQSCADYPIVTHWVADTGNPNGGLFDLAGTNPDLRRLTLQSTPQIGYQSYDNTITDDYQPTTQEALDFIHTLEQTTGFPVYMYNYDSPSALGIYPSGKLRPGLNAIQVLHNVWLQNPSPTTTLYTFIFPPGWQPTGTYPFLLFGDGAGTSNNRMIFGTPVAVARYVGLSVTQGHTGLIAALSNCGGRESQGWHDNALADIGIMFDKMKDFGVNRSNVVNFGGSRGGGTALLWGENPRLLDYTSIGVFALAPPSHPGYISQQALASYQGLAGTATNTFNDPNADRYSFSPRAIDVTLSPILTVLLNQSDPWLVDRRQANHPGDTNRKGPSGYLDKLQDKPVILSVGTHDAIIPYPMILNLDRTLWTSLHIPHLLCVTLRTGHNGDENACPQTEVENFLWALTAGPAYTVPDTRRFFKATDLVNHSYGSAVPLGDAARAQGLPYFSVTVPYRLAGFQWATLAACGQTGKAYTATLRNAAGAPMGSVGSTFGNGSTSDFNFDGVGEPDPECDVLRLDRLPWWQNLAPGTYTWTFTYDGQNVSNTLVSYQVTGRPSIATTVIDPGQPSTADALIDPGGAINMGVDNVN